MLLRIFTRGRACWATAGTAWFLMAALAGCHSPKPFQKVASAKASGESMVIKAGYVQDGDKLTFKGAADMMAAEDLYLKKEYKKAQKLFERVADDTANPPLEAEKARFFEAECKRLREYYDDAMATYNRLLKDFQYGVYREQAVGRMYEIANFWLKDSRDQIQAEQEKAEGKRWFVPWNYVHFDKRKPLLDQEGRALKMMEQVYYNDPTGPYAEKALFSAGYVHFVRQNFREADELLTQLIESSDRNGGKSEYRDRAIELAVLAKTNSAGGSDYDGRKTSESLKLIQQAKMTSPELITAKGEFLDNQAKMIHYVQAEKDFNIAEFYRRTGHPASAWFYYELVRRRYQGTEFHDQAVARMKDINVDLNGEHKQGDFARSTRREWNRIILGHEIPTLAKDQAVPAVPGVMPTHNPVVQTGQQQAIPSEFLPRR